jgi:hypothetical protein
MFYEAIYRPLEKKRLHSDAKMFIGKRIALQYGWRAVEGQNKGAHCYIPSPKFSNCIAENELEDLKNISRIRWEEIQNHAG